MPNKMTPQQFAEKMVRRATAATQDMAQGVSNVTEAPGKKAAAAQTKLIQNWNESITSGKWGKRVAAVSLTDWQTSMTEKGIPRYAAGLQASQGKIEAFAAEFLPFLDTVAAKVNTMPNMTLEDSINRMTTQIREVAKFRRGGR